MGLPPTQRASVKRAIRRATATEVITITQYGDHALVQSFRHGYDGYQVIETTVDIYGRKNAIQRAYNAAGKLVHYDVKFLKIPKYSNTFNPK